MTALRRGAHAIMATCFALSVAVQFNDPDPLPWVVVYGGALVATVLAFADKTKVWPLAALVGVVALGWAVAIRAGMPEGLLPPDELFVEPGMKTLRVEESREVLGLSIVVAWMAVVAVTTARSLPRASGSS